jgi:hypothetical protein
MNPFDAPDSFVDPDPPVNVMTSWDEEEEQSVWDWQDVRDEASARAFGGEW